MIDKTLGLQYAKSVLIRAVDSSGYLPTYRPSFLLTVCAGYSGSDVTLIVTSRVARERSEARRSLSCPTDGPSACAENTGKGGQGERGYGALHIRAWVCERRRNASGPYSVRGVPCKYLAGIDDVCTRLRKCNGKGDFVWRVRIASQAWRSLRVALLYRVTELISLMLYLECISVRNRPATRSEESRRMMQILQS